MNKKKSTIDAMKLLIFIPSPRDIPEFADAMDCIAEDKIWIKYVGYDYTPNPYQRAVNFFLKHPEYTHLAICPDDLIVTQEGVDMLKNNAQDKQCVMGVCNVDAGENEDRLAVCLSEVHPDRQKRKYDFLTRDNIPKKQFKARWCGTPFAILERKIVERLEWVGDMIDGHNTLKGVQAFDVGICHQLNRWGIPIWVNPQAEFKHMRYGGKKMVGIEMPDVWLDIVGKPRIKNIARNADIINEKLVRFRKDDGTHMAWVDDLIGEMARQIMALSAAEESWVWRETLEKPIKKGSKTKP